MSWTFLRTFKQQTGFTFTFSCEIRENTGGTDVVIDTRDFSVTYDPEQGVAAAAADLKRQVCDYIKLILVSRSPQVTTPTVVTISAADLA